MCECQDISFGGRLSAYHVQLCAPGNFDFNTFICVANFCSINNWSKSLGGTHRSLYFVTPTEPQNIKIFRTKDTRHTFISALRSLYFVTPTQPTQVSNFFSYQVFHSCNCVHLPNPVQVRAPKCDICEI